jgi:hypothetical protein
MIERRDTPRDKVIYGGTASIGDRGATRDCVVRNISDKGANVEFGSVAGLPADLTLTIARKGRSFLAKVVWWGANTVGVAFRDVPDDSSDLGERLRRSEKKKRELQRRIKILLGEG